MPLSKRRSSISYQLEVQPDLIREGALAAPDHGGREEGLALIDQIGCEGVAGELGAADGEV
jgi:hypothetical protein